MDLGSGLLGPFGPGDDSPDVQELAQLPDSILDNFHVQLIWDPLINCDIELTPNYRGIETVDLSDGEKF